MTSPTCKPPWADVPTQSAALFLGQGRLHHQRVPSRTVVFTHTPRDLYGEGYCEGRKASSPGLINCHARLAATIARLR
jgi:hypothetical protein